MRLSTRSARVIVEWRREEGGKRVEGHVKRWGGGANRWRRVKQMEARQTAGWHARGLEAHRREGDGRMVLGCRSWRLHQSRAAVGSHAEAGGHGGRGLESTAGIMTLLMRHINERGLVNPASENFFGSWEI
ncbi:hypothetical protein M405DRAFT_842816 [Rhizopogon salebrosus TDB-379]|nr:hypothetical protein M405DRAFT_842816 [Rhizopogon salebrosus TDB-379]